MMGSLIAGSVYHAEKYSRLRKLDRPRVYAMLFVSVLLLALFVSGAPAFYQA